ncbi:hypothetical protein BC940DRAFT_294256 [Gongronella butleri]|nr:hypothetical protein BC940DRAFT_294256 [Gongronella butleri]
MSTAILPTGATLYEPQANNYNLMSNPLPPSPPQQHYKDEEDTASDHSGSTRAESPVEDVATQVSDGKKKKKLRRSVGLVVVDPATQKILLLSSRKREGKYVLPKADCGKGDEPFELTAQRLLLHDACVQTVSAAHRIGVFVEANKKGKTIAHHCMYQVDAFKSLPASPDDTRTRIWVSYDEALQHTQDRNMSRLALVNMKKPVPTKASS